MAIQDLVRIPFESSAGVWAEASLRGSFDRSGLLMLIDGLAAVEGEVDLATAIAEDSGWEGDKPTKDGMGIISEAVSSLHERVMREEVPQLAINPFSMEHDIRASITGGEGAKNSIVALVNVVVPLLTVQIAKGWVNGKYREGKEDPLFDAANRALVLGETVINAMDAIDKVKGDAGELQDRWRLFAGAVENGVEARLALVEALGGSDMPLIEKAIEMDFVAGRVARMLGIDLAEASDEIPGMENTGHVMREWRKVKDKVVLSLSTEVAVITSALSDLAAWPVFDIHTAEPSDILAVWHLQLVGLLGAVKETVVPIMKPEEAAKIDKGWEDMLAAAKKRLLG